MTDQLPMPIERLLHWEATQPDRTFLRQRRDGGSDDLSWRETADRVRRIAAMLRQAVPEPGSRIAISARNCTDWFLCDLAILYAGHVSVPVYPGVAVDGFRYIMEHADVQLVFFGPTDNVEDLAAALPEHVAKVSIGGLALSGARPLGDVIRTTEPLIEPPLLPAEHVFTLMYTSGTTGHPKGVMHSLDTLAFAVPDLQAILGSSSSTRLLSYLPLAHAAERILVEMISVYCGGTVTFAESADTFLADLQATRPTFFFSVPRLWRKLKDGIEARIPPRLLRVLLATPLIAPVLRRKLLAGLGLDAADFFLTGSAPTPHDVHAFFLQLGVRLRDGYGMTENFLYGTIAQGEEQVTGTVGTPVGSGEVRISDRGEVLMRSHALMKGYYRDPERTAETLVDGWLHTGDKGVLDDAGNLRIVGRLGDTFKTTKGKFIDPTRIEDRCSALSLVESVCVMGHGLEQPVAVGTLLEVAHEIPWEELEPRLAEDLATLNAELPGNERIACLGVTRAAWVPESGLVTPTLKIVRSRIEDRFRPALEAADGRAVIDLDPPTHPG